MPLSESAKAYYIDHPAALWLLLTVAVAWFDFLGLIELAAALGLWGNGTLVTRVLVGAVGVVTIGFFTGLILLALHRYRERGWPPPWSRQH